MKKNRIVHFYSMKSCPEHAFHGDEKNDILSQVERWLEKHAEVDIISADFTSSGYVPSQGTYYTYFIIYKE